MKFLLAGLVVLLTCECFVRLPLMHTVAQLRAVLTKSFSVIRAAAVSDHWKERVLPRYSLITLGHTLKLSAILLIAFLPATLMSLAVQLLGVDLFTFLLEPVGIVYATAVGVVYVALRSRSKDASYGPLDRVLHHIALGNRSVAEASYDMAQALDKPDRDSIVRVKHVFIAGLARAGTTVLMRRFYATGQYRSLTYRDMPFVLMPNQWRKLSGHAAKEGVAKERAHADGLKVDFDSPEALEEVFWRVFEGRNYIRPDHLAPMEGVDDETIEKFQSYVASIVSGSDGADPMRYLSKNNNNILRLTSIRQAFPEALIIVPYREPRQHAYSLLQQHKHFSGAQQEDGFTRKYMTWLAHHEFGADHRPFRFESRAPQYNDTGELNYWLELWLNTYTWLQTHAPEHTHFVSYESLCTETETVWQELCTEADISSHTSEADALELRTHDIDDSSDEGLLETAHNLYEQLGSRA